MASFHIHLAVAKRYLEKNNLEINIKEYYRGVIEPDLTNNKRKTHYSGDYNHEDLLKYLSYKVQLDKYLASEYDNSDYQLGVFVHLVTDYLFFNDFFDNNYLANITYQDFCKDLYYSYAISNKYLTEKYNLDFMDYTDAINNNILKDIKEKKTNNEISKNILPNDKLDKFIEKVSNINLEQYKNKIIENHGNILP